MAASTDLPNTDSLEVVRSAIAWNIVKSSFPAFDPSTVDVDKEGKAYAMKLTNAYIQIFDAIQGSETISELK